MLKWWKKRRNPMSFRIEVMLPNGDIDLFEDIISNIEEMLFSRTDYNVEKGEPGYDFCIQGYDRLTRVKHICWKEEVK